MSSELRYDGRVAVVTGAGRGLGRAYALLLAQRGAAVVVNDIGVSADAERYRGGSGIGGDAPADPSEGMVARDVVREIEELGGRAYANTADISDAQGGASTVDDAVREFGRIDIVINNAGVVRQKPFADELSAFDLALTFDVHVLGALHVLRQAWPHFEAQGYGRVVNIASVEGGLAGTPGMEAYGAAKGALIAMARAFARRGAAEGIVVNGLVPSGATRNTRRKRGSDIDHRPEVVAPSVAWLCHEDCDVSGALFAATHASMRLIFTSAAEGYRSSAPGSFDLEELRDHWDEIQAATRRS